VSTRNKSHRATEIFRLHIKYHVAADLLVGWGYRFIPIQNLKCNPDILHLIPYRILPKSVVIFFIKPHTVIPAFGNFNSKLVSALMVTLFNIINGIATIIEYMWCPPHKSRGITQVIGNRILRKFNWVALLAIYQALPSCFPIFPFNTQVPKLGCFPHLLVASM
jgi:hypothetical protein